MNRMDGLSIGSIAHYHVPSDPVFPRLFSIQSVVFIALNILTLGVYGANYASLQRRTLKHLKLIKESIELDAEKIKAVWNRLELDFHKLQSPQTAAAPDQYDQFIPLRTHLFNEIQFVPAPFEPDAFNFSYFVAHLIFNCVTLGVFGFYKNYQLNHAIQQLQAANVQKINSYNTQFTQMGVHFVHKIDLAKKSLRMNGEIKDLRSVLVGQIYSAEKEIERLNGDIQQLNQSSPSITQQQTNKNLGLRELQNALYGLELQKSNLETIISGLEADRSSLVKKEKKIRIDLKNAQAGEQLANALTQEIRLKRNERKKYKELIDTLKLLGPIQREIIPLESEMIVNDPLIDQWRYLIKGMDASQIVKTLFNQCFDLMVNSQQSTGINFNRSSKMVTEGSESHLQAVYNCIALNLVKLGIFEQREGKECLRLNEEISIGSSKPVRVLSMERQLGKADPVQAFDIIFDHHDDFTVRDVKIPLGIDPIAIKQILSYLSSEHLEILFSELMGTLIPDDHPHLVKAKEFMKSSHPHVKFIRIAINLLLELGVAIRIKFNTILSPQWDLLANDDLSEPFQKMKIHQVEYESKNIEFDRWEMNVDYFEPELAEAIVVTKEAQSLILKNLSRDFLVTRFDKPVSAFLNTIKPHDGLGKQFYKSHIKIKPHGCVFVSLLTLVVSDKNMLTPKSVQGIRNAIAHFLQHHKKGHSYESLIREHYNLSLDEYIKVLRDGVDSHEDQMGNLEIELFAQVMGVRIGVFSQGKFTKLDEKGLLVPSEADYYYGPRTKEMLFLYYFASNPKTFYGLWPRIKDKSNSVDFTEANQMLKTYWESLS